MRLHWNFDDVRRRCRRTGQDTEKLSVRVRRVREGIEGLSASANRLRRAAPDLRPFRRARRGLLGRIWRTRLRILAIICLLVSLAVVWLILAAVAAIGLAAVAIFARAAMGARRVGGAVAGVFGRTGARRPDAEEDHSR